MSGLWSTFLLILSLALLGSAFGFDRGNYVLEVPHGDNRPDPACALDTVPIYKIQGHGSASPYETENVTVRGVVTASWQGNTSTYLGGFFLQDLDSDNDDTTSDAIWVYLPCNSHKRACSVREGDIITVQGTVKEWYNVTEIFNITKLAFCGRGSGGFHDTGVEPVALRRPLPRGDQRNSGWERWEGMLVKFDMPLTVVDVFNLGRRGEVLLSATGRLYAPTQLMSPGSAAAELHLSNETIMLDDDRAFFYQNRDPIYYPGPVPPGLTAANTLRVGDTVTQLTGVVTYGCDMYGHVCDWRVIPVDYDIELNHTNPRPAGPLPVMSQFSNALKLGLKVAFANVESFMNGPTFPTPRGAKTHAEYVRQRDKVVAQIIGLNADVVGLSEVQNNGYNDTSAIVDLVAAIREAGGRRYLFVRPGLEVLGTDVIAVGILYDPSVVRPSGRPAVLNSTVDPQFIDTRNRPVLAQTFTQYFWGGKFTLVVAHLKSKGSSCEDIGDPDLGDGQGNCPMTRTNASRAIVRWLARDPTQTGCDKVLVLGDMNSHAMEWPIRVFVDEAGYEPLVDTLRGRQEAYSFVFRGVSGYLDHALASPALATKVTGLSEWHINCDEPVVLGYSMEHKTAHQVDSLYSRDMYRAADHDPLLVGLNLAWPWSWRHPPSPADRSAVMAADHMAADLGKAQIHD